MAKRRVGLMVVASWALATLITGLVVWRAVAVLDDGTRTDVLSGAQVSGLLQSASATPGTTSAAATSVTIPPAPTEPPTASASTAAPVTSGATTASTRTTSAAPTTAKPPAPSPTPVVRTWTVSGGTVSVACAGQTISLLSASPADGWRVKIESRGPDRVKLEFASGEKETSVSGSCVAGVPQQSTHD